MMALGLTAATTPALLSTTLALIGCSPEKATLPPSQTPSTTAMPVKSPATPDPSATYLAVARGQSPRGMVEAAVKALGGIGRFVKSGDDVIIKPNICVAYHTYEYAATTNPEVVAALVALCRGAGARRVRVMDQPFGGTPEQAYTRTGIAKAVEEAGGQMEVMSQLKFRKTSIPDAVDITNWPVYSDVLGADVVINVPVAKHHSLARLTLGMKNLMGVVQDRNAMHSNLGQRIADISSLVKPSLTVVDCVRILMNNGPTGGNLDDVKLANTVIASRDVVAADSYAATLFGLSGADIPAVRAGAQMGIGIADLKSVRIEEISV